MDQKWISVFLLFSAVCGVSPYVPHRFHFVNQSKTWTEAQSYCRQTYTDLATINNMDEMKKVNKTLIDKGGHFVWIGLNRGDTGRWQWSLGGGNFDGDSYRNWSSGEPSNHGGIEFCVAMYKETGKWLDCEVYCEDNYRFVCLDEKNANTERYVFINETKTWHEAQSYCREHHTDLPSVRNQTENQKIWSVLKTGERIWIGLFNDSWKWSDQSSSSFRYWLPRQPDTNDKCAAASVKDQSQWHDVNCNIGFPFICYENELVLIQKKLSWAEALRYCRENHVDLVSVHSEEIQLWVEDLAQKASTDHVWLGLRHTCTQGFWFWTSGFTICYQNWAPGNGAEGEHCEPVVRTGAVQARGDQQWVSLPENQTLNFICIKYED